MSSVVSRLFAGFILVAATAYSACAAGPGCPFKEGDVITPIDPSVAYEKVSSMKTEAKGEFETTAEYEARRASSQTASPKEIVVRSRPGLIGNEYDADGERFNLTMENWSGSIDTDRILRELKLQEAPSGHGIGLESTVTDAGSYSASNGFGVQSTVRKSRSIDFVVFDRAKEFSDNTWQYDFGGDAPLDLGKGIWLKVPRSRAPALKEKIGYAVALSPKPPFALETYERKKPTVDDPTDDVTVQKVIVADIRCLAVIDGDNKVLRTVGIAFGAPY